MPKLRVLVVEDSLTARRRIVEALEADGEIEVVGEAGDGKAAIEMCVKVRPDVITLDMILPGLSGLAVTEYIMAYCPTPILIVSSSANRGDLFRTYDALTAGAVDILEKPDGREIDASWEQNLISRIKLISRIRVITHPRGRLNRQCHSVSVITPAGRAERQNSGGYRLVAIGASTGGPAALACILEALPRNFPVPILVVTHIAPSFGGVLSEWLNSRSSLRVNCAVDGEALPEPGHARVIMAPPGRHLVLEKNRLLLKDGPERHSCRPSIDVLFASVAAAVGREAIGCLLTGMGKDGAAGLMAIRQAGGRTLAQDEATSAIFGMPREAIRLGAAERVLGMAEFAPALAALACAAPSYASMQ